MTLEIQLIGPPRIVDEAGAERAIRGYQSWALLARLLLADRELTRREASAELFPDTADPLGSLRWCLAGLRRAVGASGAFTGDPIRVDLPPGTRVDVLLLRDGALDVDVDGELLEGIEPRCGPEFGIWLLVQRQRVAGLVDAQLRERALEAMWAGDDRAAVDLAERAARRSPFDEGAQILLVKSLAAMGMEEAAVAHAEATAAVFRAELGIDPSPALFSAARRSVADPPAGVSAAAVARSLRESGSAAIAAGAAEAGLDCLRRAAAEAERSGDDQLLATCLLDLGTALVHTVRGYNDEGSVLLGRAADQATQIGDRTVATAAHRELGYVDAMAGRRPRAAAHLDRALTTAEGDPELLAGVHSIIGFNLVDWGRTDEGLDHYGRAVEHAVATANGRQEAWALGLGAWGHACAGDPDVAERWVTRCLELVGDQRWVAFRPWPLAVRAELALARGDDPVAVRSPLEETFALSCQLGDPCWEGATARLLARTHLASGDADTALGWITQARERCQRETDPWVAMYAAILADDVIISLAAGEVTRADATARLLVALAARDHMDGHLATAVDLLRQLGA